MEDTARALGAGSPTTIMIAGKECQPRPLKAKELAEVQRDGLNRYKDEYLDCFCRNAKYYPEETRNQKIDEEIKKVSSWDVNDLPAKVAYDAAEVDPTPGLKSWLIENFGGDEGISKDDATKVATVFCLENGILSPEKYQDLTGKAIRQHRIAYIQWWVTGHVEGMITMAWVCFKHNGVTRDQVAESLGHDEVKAAKVAKEIAELSTAGLGN